MVNRQGSERWFATVDRLKIKRSLSVTGDNLFVIDVHVLNVHLNIAQVSCRWKYNDGHRDTATHKQIRLWAGDQ